METNYPLESKSIECCADFRVGVRQSTKCNKNVKNSKRILIDLSIKANYNKNEASTYICNHVFG